jgi:hypothetical protein
MDARLQRLADNEHIFRSLNERIAAVSGERLEIVCECSAEGCTERIMVGRDEYTAVREHPRRFLVCPGHEIPAIEIVVDANDRFLVVEKTLV